MFLLFIIFTALSDSDLITHCNSIISNISFYPCIYVLHAWLVGSSKDIPIKIYLEQQCLLLLLPWICSKLQRVCLATASPAKFTEAVLSAGLTPQPTEAIERLQHLPPKYQDVEQTDDWDAILRRAITDISQHHLQGSVWREVLNACQLF